MLLGKLVFDERSKRKFEETATAVLGLFYIVCPIEMLIKIIITHDPSTILGEAFILISVTAAFLTVHRLDKNYFPSLPRKNNGELLNAEKTRRAKLQRMVIYAKESIITATGFIIFWGGMDYFLYKQRITWDVTFFIDKLANIIIASIICFTINSIYKERRIKAFNKLNEKLDK